MLDRPIVDDGRVEPGEFIGRPCDLSGCAPSADPLVSFFPRRLLVLSSASKKTGMRSVALGVHLDFCEVAIVEDGELRSAGRIETTPEQIEDAREAPGSRVARRGVGARPSDVDDAPAPVASLTARVGAQPVQEPDPRGAGAPAPRPPAVLRRVRRQGPAVALEGCSCRPRSQETVSAAMRQIEFLDSGDLRDRAPDLTGGPRVGGDQAPPSRVRASSAATSASIRWCANRASGPRRTGTSQSGAPPGRVTPWWRRARRQPCASPAPFTPSISASALAAGTRWRSSRPRRCLLRRGGAVRPTISRALLLL